MCGEVVGIIQMMSGCHELRSGCGGWSDRAYCGGPEAE